MRKRFAEASESVRSIHARLVFFRWALPSSVQCTSLQGRRQYHGISDKIVISLLRRGAHCIAAVRCAWGFRAHRAYTPAIARRISSHPGWETIHPTSVHACNSLLSDIHTGVAAPHIDWDTARLLLRPFFSPPFASFNIACRSDREVLLRIGGLQFWIAEEAHCKSCLGPRFRHRFTIQQSCCAQLLESGSL